MVYFLGRDVKVGICSEDASHGVEVSDGDPRTLAVGTGTSGNIIEKLWNTSGDANDGGSKYNSFSDVTSVDITLGKVDEDIAYMGQRTALKAEIKNESTVVITKKKDNDFWDLVWMKARHGVSSDNNLTGNQLKQPDGSYGYRLAVQLSSATEVITLPNCVMSDKSTSLNADGVSEETLTFITSVEPLIDTVAYVTATTTAL